MSTSSPDDQGQAPSFTTAVPGPDVSIENGLPLFDAYNRVSYFDGTHDDPSRTDYTQSSMSWPIFMHSEPAVQDPILDQYLQLYQQNWRAQQQRYSNIMFNKGHMLSMDDVCKLMLLPDQDEERKDTLLAKILRLYHAGMAGDVRSPLVHLVGPPGCGKSLSVEQAADILGVKLHLLNVSRMSPLELEGVQMPTDQNTRLTMLTATWWKDLKEGDIVMFDEFLRGFPEIYNGLLDVLTARRVGAFDLPKVFFIAASNTMASYDKALDDRLLHLIVPDPRKSKSEKAKIAKLLIEATGMMPELAMSFQMEDLLNEEILPTFEMIDVFLGKPNVSAQSIKGHSLRHLIGQVRLREIQSKQLKELLLANNREAMAKGRYQFVILPDGKNRDPLYEERARKLVGNPRLTEVQAQNLDLNLQLIEMETAMSTLINIQEDEDDDDDDPLS